MFLCREESELRPSRDPPEPSSKSTTESKSRHSVFIRINRLTTDFHTNKRIIDDVAIIQSKRLRNKIAGNNNRRN